MQASYSRTFLPNHAARHMHLDHHLAADVLTDAVRQMATHAADRHSALVPYLTEMC